LASGLDDHSAARTTTEMAWRLDQHWGHLYDQVGSWLEQGKLQCPRVVEMDMTDIAAAHDLIQSGKSIGKIVMQTHVKLD
jgi:NADPH:quinone reductase-like Zn-dependent oxidoreductase